MYVPKEAHSRIFVIGGSFYARQMVPKKKASWGGELVADIAYEYSVHTISICTYENMTDIPTHWQRDNSRQVLREDYNIPCTR